MSKNPIQLYRALLRESNYLLDQNARQYFQNHISSSFRRYLPKDPKFPFCRPRSEAVIREESLLKRAFKLHSLLYRANHGDAKAFEKVAKLTYGREGKRRRELMGELMQESEANKVKQYEEGWKPPDIIRSLIKSQFDRQRVIKYTNRTLHPEGPKIPELNIWGRPTPKKRAKNLRRKWYAKNLNTIYPPLPTSEWDQIKSVVLGERRLDEAISRRPAAKVPVFATERSETEPHMSSSRAQRRKSKPPRPLRARTIRRLMVRVLSHIPVPVAHSDSSKPPLYKWEGHTNLPFRISHANNAETRALFE